MFLLLSQHLGFFRLIDPFIRSDDSRIFVRHDRTQSSRPYNHLADHFHHSSRFTSFSPPPVYYGTLYISRKSHASHFFTHKSLGTPPSRARPDDIYPLRSEPGEHGLMEKCLFRGLALLIVPVSPSSPVFVWVAARDLYYILRPSLPSLPRYFKASISRRDLSSTFCFFIKRTIYFLHSACHADFVAT